MAGNTVKERARHCETSEGTTSAPLVSLDDVLLALAPLDAPLVVGQRGLAELLGDLAIATDDLNS